MPRDVSCHVRHGAPDRDVASRRGAQRDATLEARLPDDLLRVAAPDRYFASPRPTASSATQIFTSHRASLATPWQPPSPVVDFPIAGGNGNQEDPWSSLDGRTFAFASNAAGSKDIYISISISTR